MLNVGKVKFNTPKKLSMQADSFSHGVNKLVRDTRLSEDEAAEAVNLIQVQDGLWKPRWGTKYYGGDYGGSVVDGFQEYIKSDGTRELIVVANGKVWKRDGDSKTEITGATFTAGTPCYFLQIDDYLYISNGTDNLARYGGSTLSTYSELSAPANPSLTRGAGLSAGDYTYYYQVTALNAVGETVGSTEQSVTVDIERSTWAEADEYVDFSWDAVGSATRYQVYIADESGYETLLASVGTNSYRDDNTDTANPYIEIPDDNTTGAPKFKHMWMSGNRMWATGNPDNEHRVYFSGTGVDIGHFSDYYGGGWVDLEKGGRNTPIAGVHFHDGQGSGRSTVLCNTPEGKGSVWQIPLVSVEVGSETFTVPSPRKIVGSLGTVAPRSVINVGNDVWFLRGGNNPGVFILGNEKQYWGILRTNEVSSKLRPFFQGLSQDNLDKACSYFYEGKVFFSLPEGDDNDTIVYFDTERSTKYSVWGGPWTTGVTQFGEFTDSDGETHLLGGLTDDGYLVEFNENFQGDLGTAFEAIYKSPRIPVSDDWTQFAKIKDVFVRLGYPQGAVSITIAGTEKGEDYSNLASQTFVPGGSTTGWNWDKWNTLKFNTSGGTPETFSSASNIRYIRVNKRLRDIQIKISSSALDSEWTLLGWRIEGRPITSRAPRDWKLS